MVLIGRQICDECAWLACETPRVGLQWVSNIYDLPSSLLHQFFGRVGKTLADPEDRTIIGLVDVRSMQRTAGFGVAFTQLVPIRWATADFVVEYFHQRCTSASKGKQTKALVGVSRGN